MAICWLAKQSIVSNNIAHIYDAVSSGRGYLTVIAHIAEGNSCAAIKGWFETYPKTDKNGKVFPENQQYAGAHFGVEKNGSIVQFVDTKYICYGAGPANTNAIHVEHCGFHGDELTDAQVEALANLLAWANATHGVSLQLNFNPPPIDFSNTTVDGKDVSIQSRVWKVGTVYPPLNSGLGFHSQYGGHPQCPGPKIIWQLPDAVQIALDIQSGARDWALR
jgi:hypothetical protein